MTANFPHPISVSTKAKMIYSSRSHPLHSKRLIEQRVGSIALDLQGNILAYPSIDRRGQLPGRSFRKQHLRAAPILWFSLGQKSTQANITYALDSQELLDIEEDLNWMKAGLNFVEGWFVILMFRWKPVQQTTTLPGMNQTRYDDGHTLGNVVAFPCPLLGEIFQSPRSKT